MKLTAWQIDILRKWHSIDFREGRRMWNQPYTHERGTCEALAKRGLMEHVEIMGRSMYALTDAGIKALEGTCD